MKIFITGGTGFVGREIVRQLHEEGRTIRLLVRDPDSERVQEIISRYRVEVHTGNGRTLLKISTLRERRISWRRRERQGSKDSFT